MSFNYGMKGKTSQQKAIVRQREKAEKMKREEFGRKKILDYEFDYESVKSELNEKELSHFMDYVHEYKGIIIREVLRNERLKMRDLETPLEIGETDLGNNYLQSVYKTFQFTKVDDYVIKITKIT